jgi:hypothetical protein
MVACRWRISIRPLPDGERHRRDLIAGLPLGRPSGLLDDLLDNPFAQEHAQRLPLRLRQLEEQAMLLVGQEHLNLVRQCRHLLILLRP